MTRLHTMTSALLLLGAVRTAAAQEYASNAHGTFKLRSDNVAPEIPAAQASAGLKAADTILAILKKTELFRTLTGVSIEANREVSVEPGGWQAGRPYYYGVEVRISLLVRQEASALPGDGPYIDVVIRGNSSGCGDVDDAVPADGGPPVTALDGAGARITGEYRGHPVYDGSCLFMTAHPGSPTVPVTKERYLKIRIAQLRNRGARNRASMQGEERNKPSEAIKASQTAAVAGKAPVMDCAEMVKAIPDASSRKTAMDQCKQGNAQIVAQWAQAQGQAGSGGSEIDSTVRANRMLADSGLKDEAHAYELRLAALSPAERRRQAAIVHGFDGDSLTDVKDPTALPLEQLNTSFFDKATPPYVPQVISVGMPGLQAGFMPSGFGDGSSEANQRRVALGTRLRDQLDWAALEKLLRRNP